jgi:hypothetical protein
MIYSYGTRYRTWYGTTDVTIDTKFNDDNHRKIIAFPTFVFNENFLYYFATNLIWDTTVILCEKRHYPLYEDLKYRVSEKLADKQIVSNCCCVETIFGQFSQNEPPSVLESYDG